MLDADGVGDLDGVQVSQGEREIEKNEFPPFPALTTENGGFIMVSTVITSLFRLDLWHNHYVKWTDRYA